MFSFSAFTSKAWKLKKIIFSELCVPKKMDGVVKKKVPLIIFDFDRTITNLNTDTEVPDSKISILL